MIAFLIIAIVLAVGSLLAWLFTFTLNGKGPSAGFLGMMILDNIKWALVAAAVSFALWLGAVLERLYGG